MVIRSGLGAQLGIGEQSDYDTFATPTRFLPFEKEGIALDVGKIRTAGLGLGRFHRTNKVRSYVKGAAGPIDFVLENKGFGLLLKHCFGAVSSANSGAVYTHTFTPDANALFGKWLTVQIGRPDIAGTGQPFSFLGGKVTNWELSAALDGPVMLVPNFDFKTAIVSEALASASYASAPVDFTFVDGAITYGGSSRFVKDVKVRMAHGLSTERRGLGNTKLEPIAGAMADVEGDLSLEFEDLDDRAAWIADTQAALVLTFTNPLEITSGNAFRLTVTIPKIEFMGADAKVEGPGVLNQPTPFKALYDGSNAIITAAYRTSDTSP